MIRVYKSNLIGLTNRITNKIKHLMLKESKTHIDKTLFVKKKKKLWITFYVRVLILVMYSPHKHRDPCLCGFERTYITCMYIAGHKRKIYGFDNSNLYRCGRVRDRKTSPWGVTVRKGAKGKAVRMGLISIFEYQIVTRMISVHHSPA